jgi:hypothetical protein
MITAWSAQSRAALITADIKHCPQDDATPGQKMLCCAGATGATTCEIAVLVLCVVHLHKEMPIMMPRRDKLLSERHGDYLCPQLSFSMQLMCANCADSFL